MPTRTQQVGLFLILTVLAFSLVIRVWAAGR
jgi:hypothetical protein